MSLEDLECFNSLPDKLKIYRGGSIHESKTGFGISWTLNKEVAEKFVRIKKSLSDEEMVIHELIISKSMAVAYLNHRNEEEIIFLNN